MRRFFILGDTGLLGQTLVAVGKSQGHEVRGGSRHSADFPLDALDAAALEHALDVAQPEIVINAAGLIDVNRCEQVPEAAWLVNARLPALLASQCAVRNIRLVHVSTDHYYSNDGPRPHTEEHLVSLLNEYARTKYAGEYMALTCPNALVIRTNIVGFRGWDGSPTFVEWLLHALERKAPIELYSDFYASSISTSQFSEILFQLLDTSADGVLNVASRQGASKLEFAHALAASCGLSTEATRPGSVKSISGVRRAESLVLCTKRAEAILGTRLPDLDAVVEQLAHEYHSCKTFVEVNQ